MQENNSNLEIPDIEAQNIEHKIQCVSISIKQNENLIKKYQQELESHKHLSTMIQEITENLPITAVTNQHEEKLFNIGNHIINLRKEILCSSQQIVFSLHELQNILIQRLNKWKDYQILTGYGDRGVVSVQIAWNLWKLPSLVLNEIENWFTQLYEICGKMLESFSAMQTPQFVLSVGNEFEPHCNDIANLQRQLIVSSLIIEVQPPQIIKKDTRSIELFKF